MPVLRFLLVIGVLPVLAACSDGSENVVAMVSGLRFEPQTVTVEAGTTVTFVNEDREAHTVTALQNLVPEGEYFASGGFSNEADALANISDGLLATDESYEVTFDEPGTYVYFCIPHHAQGMEGTVIVEGG